MVANLPWFSDDMTEDEQWAIGALIVIAYRDTGLANMVANLPWFSDDMTEDEQWVISDLSNIADRDAELANMVANLPWLSEDIIEDEQWRTLDALSRIAVKDTGLANMVANLPWFSDDITQEEQRALSGLGSADADLASIVADLPWFSDDISQEEQWVISDLNDIASTDAKLANMIANLPWFSDGITKDERGTLDALGDIAYKDAELANMVANLPWFSDGITKDERQTLGAMNNIAGIDRDWASQLALSMNNRTRARDLEFYVTASLGWIAREGPDALGRLTSQSWYADGLSDEEFALVSILGGGDIRKTNLYDSLLGSHFIQTRKISLPLAGDVNIYVVENDPPSIQDEDLLTIIEDAARISEGFMQVPFPTSDIILLIAGHEYGLGSAHRGTFITLQPVSWDTVYVVVHETAHYYFNHFPFDAYWLVEGGANFIASYFEDRIGVQSMATNKTEVSVYVQDICIRNGLENIRHLTYLFDLVYLSASWPPRCVYLMGEHFLINIFETIGEDAMSAALRELYLQSYDSGQAADEEAIYNAFLKHTPDDKKEDLRDLYRKLHGGAFVFDEGAFDDDHGDEAATASEIAVGEAVMGELDYMFDFDYFSFRAEEGRKYRMIVTHDTLRSTSIGLYAPDGVTGENQRWIFRDSTTLGPGIVWIAPSSDTYYVAVQNFGGKTGTYTLTITPVDGTIQDAEDSATEISVGETVEGTITDEFDIDYFRFSQQENQQYSITVTSGTLEHRSRIRHPNEQSYFGWLPGNVFWTAWTTGESFLAVRGASGSVGSYTVTIRR